MPMYPKDYEELVLDDLKTYAGLSHPVKASFLERMFRTKVRIDSLHPNPDDEFCNPDIGPNFGIVDHYVQEWSPGQIWRKQSI